MRLERHDFDADYIGRLVSGDAETERHFTDYFGQLLVLKLRRAFARPLKSRTPGRRPSCGCFPR